MQANSPRMLAAVDLGSNSFRMVIARVVGDQLQLVDRLREGVRLAAALDEHKMLSEEGQRRGLACLEQFGERLRDLPPGSVRAVGTNTLRQARNAYDFLGPAQRLLGHRIEVVSGQEEARLVYLGAAHSLAGGMERRLVVDIGGGSTECILGRGYDPTHTESLYMGCVSYTLRHFPDGQLSRENFRRATIAARLEIQGIEKTYTQTGWDVAAGSSGTIAATAEILRQNGWAEQGITAKGLKKLRKAVIRAEHIDRLQIRGLKAERARVFPGGLAILSAVFKGLKVDRMVRSSGALREGLLFDLLGRFRHEDVRERTIQRFLHQYHVDLPQAWRVERSALEFLQQVASPWGLEQPEMESYLSWGARLHEVGLIVAHAGFHKHGAYLVAHSDMPGFSAQDQKSLSLLVRGHRRKFPQALFDELPSSLREPVIKLCCLLRLAALLHRRRQESPPVRLEARAGELILRFSANSLNGNPLTRADLEREAAILQSEGILRLNCLEVAPEEPAEP